MTQSHSTAPFVLDSHLTSQQKFLKLMNEFRMAQEKRPSIYKKFEEVFKEYLDSDDLVHYNNCVKEITNAFLNVSLTIRAVENYFRELNFGETMANLIRQLQLLEKEKLSLTSELQILRKNLVDLEDKDTEYKIPQLQQQLQTTSTKLNETILNINEKLEEIKYEEAELTLLFIEKNDTL